MPTVSRLNVAPVKGLALQHPDEVRIERDGVPGNRTFFLLDERGRLFSGIQHGALVRVVAGYDTASGRLALRFPDGEVVAGEVADGRGTTVDMWGRPVGCRVVGGPWAAALSEYVGKRLTLVRAEREGGGYDECVVSLLSNASLEELRRQSGHDGPVDGRRFRMLVTLEGCGPHEEDTWKGRLLRVGEALVRVVGECGRCATTTQNPESGARDFDTLREIKAYRGLVGDRLIPFGIYADVEEPGTVRVGDPVEPLD